MGRGGEGSGYSGRSEGKEISKKKELSRRLAEDEHARCREEIGGEGEQQT